VKLRRHQRLIDNQLRRAKGARTSLPNILIPQICMFADEIAHHANAFRVVQHNHGRAMLPEEILSAFKISIFTNNDARDPKQQSRASAHDAGTERAHQRQLRPVAAAASVAQAYSLRMGRRVAALNPQVVSPRYNLSALVS
jgi:hypothetical protein